jgi:hypothetical protein
MQKRFTILETALISLLVGNLISSIYLEPKTTAAVAATDSRPPSLIPTASNCKCPTTPPAK